MVSQPDYPDPNVTANAQSGMNRDSAIASALVNNYDQTSPWGSVSYDQQGTRSYTDSQGNNVDVPYFSQNISLSPDQQNTWNNTSQAYNNFSQMANNTSGALTDYLSTPYDPNYGTTTDAAGNTTRTALTGNNAINDWQPSTVGDYSADRTKVEDAIMSRYNRQFSQDESAMDQKLRNQGLTPGSEAYKTQYDALTRQKNDAEMQAILAGGQEQTRLNNLDQGSAAFNNQLRQSKINEGLTMRNQPINEMIGLLNGSQINVPQTSAPFQSGVGAPNYSQLVDNQYQAQSQAAQNSNQGLFSILGMIPGLFSDRRVKKDIKRLGSHGRLGIYRFKYLGSNEDVIGVMADEVDQKAVTYIAGIAQVNYLEALNAR